MSSRNNTEDNRLRCTKNIIASLTRTETVVHVKVVRMRCNIHSNNIGAAFHLCTPSPDRHIEYAECIHLTDQKQQNSFQFVVCPPCHTQNVLQDDLSILLLSSIAEFEDRFSFHL